MPRCVATIGFLYKPIESFANDFCHLIMMTSSSSSNTRQAWVLVVGLGVVMAVSFGISFNAFSIFTLPIVDTFNGNLEQAARIATVFMITMTLTMPAAGWLLDHAPPRPVMTLGAVVTALGYLMAAHSDSLNMFTAAIGLAGVGVGASTYVPAFTLITRWISPRRQGLAFGVLLAVAAVGGIFFPLLLTRMIAAFGLRGTLEGCAAMVFFICLPLLLWLVRLPPADLRAAQQAATDADLPGGIGKALCMPRYWLWVAMFLLITLSSLSILMGLVPYLVSVGYTTDGAAVFYGSIAAAAIVGSLLFGALSTRWGVGRTLALGVTLSSVGIVCLLAAPHPSFGFAALVVFVLIGGTTFNLVNQLSPTLLMEFIGQRNFGSLLGIGNLVSGLGAAMGPTIFGYLVDSSKDYVFALSLTAALMAFALLPLLMLMRAPKLARTAIAVLP